MDLAEKSAVVLLENRVRLADVFTGLTASADEPQWPSRADKLYASRARHGGGFLLVVMVVAVVVVVVVVVVVLLVAY